MTAPATSARTAIDLEGLGLDQGGHLLLKRALAGVAVGEAVEVRGSAAELAVHVRAWCRAQGHGYDWPYVVRGPASGARRSGAEVAGGLGGVADRPPATWGVAARGALVEAGGPAFPFALDEKAAVWTDAAAGIYRQAAASQWDPATAVDWTRLVSFLLVGGADDEEKGLRNLPADHLRRADEIVLALLFRDPPDDRDDRAVRRKPPFPLDLLRILPGLKP